MPSPPPLARVRKAYEQVADQLRELVLTGQLEPGEKLPTETELASSFGVSRATVREALRILAAENLIRTGKGPTGGSFVIRPSAAQLADYMSGNIRLLTQANDITLEDLLAARELLEVPAAGVAARRADADDLARIERTIPSAPDTLDRDEQFTLNRDFHSVLLDVAGNPLLKIAAQPIFIVLQSHLARADVDESFNEVIHAGHRRIEAAVRDGDASLAEAEMAEHLHALRPLYKRIWKLAIERD